MTAASKTVAAAAQRAIWKPWMKALAAWSATAPPMWAANASEDLA